MTTPQRIDDLTAALRAARESYLSGITDSLTWVRERRMIWREAEYHGITVRDWLRHIRATPHRQDG